jgi:adenine-specific DNA-methyltransferase
VDPGMSCAVQPEMMSQAGTDSAVNAATIDVRRFPTTRYQGSKRKIIPWLHKVFSSIEFDSALDLFGGSTSVSYLLKRMGKRVACNDVLHWNYLAAVALIQNKSVLLEAGFKVIAPPLSERNRYRVIRDRFRGFYFTEYENAWLDRAVFSIDRIDGSESGCFYKKAIAHYALFQACLVKRPFNLFHRKNLYLRTANVERSFGNKTTWDTPITTMFSRFAKEANRCVFRGAQNCTAHNCDAEDFPDVNYDLIYLDVPYVSDKKSIQTSDYLVSYHFLEGLSRYHDWPEMIDSNSSLLAIKQTKPNPFTSPETNKPALRKLFERFKDSTFVISYKRFGTPSISWFKKELQQLGKRVSCQTRHYKYALNHQNGDAALNREIIIVAR